MTLPADTAQPPAHDGRAAADRLVAFYESLTPQSLAELDTLYSPHAYFKDPFNEVRGLAEVRGIFTHMYTSLESPRFVVTERLVDGDQCFLVWNFEFRFKAFDKTTLQTIRGGSHVKFTADGLVDFHRDYWDAAEELYEKLPWVGALMRWLKKRARS